MTMDSVCVWVVSDDERFQNAVSFALSESGLSCSRFSSSQHALEMLCVTCPPFIVVDNELVGMSGMDLVFQFRLQYGWFPYVIITRHGTVDLAVDAMKNGAVTVLEMPIPFEKLVEAVKSGVKINAARRLSENQRNEFASRFQALTAREREIAELVFEGKLSKQIAKELSISHKTVEVHRSRIAKKLEIESVTQLVKLMQSTRS